MNEQNVKKRGWVKNAAIIFLAAMVVLTFFSNDIMNRSLPEVSAQYATSGTINARIRGSGQVSANSNYEVLFSQTRTVQEVRIRTGDVVSAGDILFVLAGDSSEELDKAQDDLYGLLLELETMLIENSLDGDYAAENRNIRLKREDIAEAQERLLEMPYSEAAIAAAEAVVEAARALVAIEQGRIDEAQVAIDVAVAAIVAAEVVAESRQRAVTDATRQLSHAAPGGDAVSLSRSLTENANALREKEDSLAFAKVRHGDDYDEFVHQAMLYAVQYASPTTLYPSETEEDEAAWKTFWDRHGTQFMAEFAEFLSPNHPYRVAYRTITGLEGDIIDLRAARNELLGQFGNAGEYNRLQSQLESAQALYDAAQAAVGLARTQRDNLIEERARIIGHRDAANDRLGEARTDLADEIAHRTAWQGANDTIREMVRDLEGDIFRLSQQQRSDGITTALKAVALRELENRIERKRAEITALESEDTGSIITSPVYGVVKTIDNSLTPGNQTPRDVPLVIIEITDRGYFVEFTVTAEQARRVTVGDIAEANVGWWGAEEINARLVAIRNHPQNPTTSRLLRFELTGGVQSDMTVNITLGQRSENYEVIVPNAAIRQDSEGDFVLVVVARPSPLGNRFIATRVDVTVMATDDTHSAVTGGIVGWDFVITRSASPIEPGMQVRLADNP